jgi:hypothetical protein
LLTKNYQFIGNNLGLPTFPCGDLNGIAKEASAKNRAAFEFCLQR